MTRALIVGLSGLTLTHDEAAFLRTTRPCGVILFTRNVDTPEQVKALVDAIQMETGSDATLILVDQEGGRVQRLRPPHWRALCPAARYGAAARGDLQRAVDMAQSVARLTADDLRACGITSNCAPCADLPVAGAHAIIGDRAYSDDGETVVALARSVATGLMDGGVLPVVKHIPGHGRADADSHLELPRVATTWEVLRETDFATFRTLADLPAAMTAHVIYSAIDPVRPATVSPIVMDRVIRGDIGFTGLVMTDDLSMQALTGSIAERASASLAAGCDVVLHCNGTIDEMRALADVVPVLSGAALSRFEVCRAITGRVRQLSPAERRDAERCLDGLMAGPGDVEKR